MLVYLMMKSKIIGLMKGRKGFNFGGDCGESLDELISEEG